jgi:hypothetical protein
MPGGLAPRDVDGQIARRALLLCREIVRAEKTYRAVLQLLQGQQGQCLSRPCTTSVASVAHRAHTDLDAHAATDADIPAALFDTSDRLLARLHDDPSALSLARAFVASHPSLRPPLSRGAALLSGSRSSPRRPRARRARSAHAAPRRRSLRHLPAAHSARPRRWWLSGAPSSRSCSRHTRLTLAGHTCSRCVS